jgi:glycerate 2-kinase
MKKILCIPDSFKGTLSSKQVCSLMRDAILHQDPSIEVITIEVADGGEGSVDAFLSAMGGEKIDITVTGPEFFPVPSFFGILPDGVAVIEMAAAAGLPMVGDRKNPEIMTTFGVGELIKAALDHGAPKVIVGLGGSCTNDGGCGAAAALGVRFLDHEGHAFVPTGKTLSDIVTIDRSRLDPRLARITLDVMCDIDNPMYGLNGAAHVFGPQKGADKAMVERLDRGLAHLAACISEQLAMDVSGMPGGGAAGAMGAGMVAFLGGQLKMGIETILDTVHFDEQLVGADLVLTGEGRFDTQSLRGKVPIGVARRAKKAGVNVIAVVGAIGDNIDEAYEMGITALFSINTQPVDFAIAKGRSADNLYMTISNLIRILR